MTDPATLKNVVEAKAAASTGGISLTAKQVGELAALMDGTLIRNGQDLVDKLKRSQQVRFPDGLEVTLTTSTLWQLRQQATGMGEDYASHVRRFIDEAVVNTMWGQVIK